MRLVLVSSIVLALTLTAKAAPADDDPAAQARAHYQKATAHFAVGEFSAAAAEYEEAFKLHQDEALLFNAAQSRRLAGENEKALVLYRNFLHFYPKSPNIAQVKEQIAKLQEAIASAHSAKTSPPVGTVEPNASSPLTAPSPGRTTETQPNPPPETAAPPPAAAATAPPPEHHAPAILHKWWFWTAVGAVVVAAVVIPVAVVESSSNWTNLPNQGPAASAAIGVRW
jgi:tetratricopeptide (TPR) repeat protein